MQTYRLYLIGESDGVVYGIKEYEAETEASAAALAESLLPHETVWGGQRLLKELSVDSARPH
jgi:hypothetical protein